MSLHKRQESNCNHMATIYHWIVRAFSTESTKLAVQSWQNFFGRKLDRKKIRVLEKSRCIDGLASYWIDDPSTS